MDENQLLSEIAKSPSTVGMFGLIIAWVVREFLGMKKEKAKKQENKIEELDKTLVVTNQQLTRLILEMEHLNRNMEEKFIKVVENTKDINEAHTKLRELYIHVNKTEKNGIQ